MRHPAGDQRGNASLGARAALLECAMDQRHERDSQEGVVKVGCSAWPGTTPTGGGYQAPGGTSWMIRDSAPVTDTATNQVVGWRVAGGPRRGLSR
jgi:hypothetical protein